MNIKDLKDKLHTIGGLVNEHSNRMAIDSLRELCGADESLGTFRGRLDALEQRYYYMLRFLDSTAPFDAVDTELTAVENELKTIADDMLRAYRTANDPGQYYARLRFQKARPEETLESLYADYIEESKRLATDTRVLTDTRAKSALEQIASDIFMHIWTAGVFSTDTADTVRQLIGDADIPHFDREMWLNAVGLSHLTDPQRAQILAEAYRSNDDRLSVTALMWIVINFARCQTDSALKADSTVRLTESFAESPEAQAEFMAMVSEICRTVIADNGRWTKMLSDLNSMSRGLADRLKNGNLESPAELERALSDAPAGYFDRIKAFQEAQMRGEDVYAGVIGAMPRAPFFRLVSAWFLPFHIDRSELAPIVDSEGVGMASVMEKMPMLCDNDKYSLMLSMTQNPGQTAAVFANLYESYTRMTETEEGVELLKAMEGTAPRPMLIGNAVKNLSRFMHHCPQAAEALIPDRAMPYTDLVLKLWEENLPDDAEDFADGIAEAGFADLAIGCYSAIACSNDFATDIYGDEGRARIFAKAGHAAEAAEMTERAVLYFERARESGDRSLSTAMTTARLILADPYAYFGDDPGASTSPVALLEPFADKNTDNADFLQLLARSYTAERQYQRAAETYFNLNYILSSGDHTAKGPLAEALCRCGDFDEAVQVLADVPDIEKDMPMSVTQAIALWCTGARDASVRALTAALPAVGGDARAIRHELNRRITAYFSDNNVAPNVASLYLLTEIMDYKAFGSRFGNLT